LAAFHPVSGTFLTLPLSPQANGSQTGTVTTFMIKKSQEIMTQTTTAKNTMLLRCEA
jgi:hypothetical protein